MLGQSIKTPMGEVMKPRVTNIDVSFRLTPVKVYELVDT